MMNPALNAALAGVNNGLLMLDRAAAKVAKVTAPTKPESEGPPLEYPKGQHTTDLEPDPPANDLVSGFVEGIIARHTVSLNAAMAHRVIKTEDSLIDFLA